MAKCPNCKAEIDQDANACPSCTAVFDVIGGWKPIHELTEVNDEVLNYAGFWKRVLAFLIDFGIYAVPLVILNNWLISYTRYYGLYFLLVAFPFIYWYQVLLVAAYGCTPGKYLLKLRIAKLDGANITFKEAHRRYVVYLLFSIASSIAIILAATHVSDAEYFSLDYAGRIALISNHQPSWSNLIDILMLLWMFAAFFSMLSNKQRRALHDFLAGTVVLQESKRPTIYFM